MVGIYVLLGSLCLLLAGWFVACKRRSVNDDKKDQSLLRLEEVIKTSQLTNDGFFRSLELVQKNLESLLARAESAEQRLRSLMLQPGVEKKEQYTAAALLLAEGQEPQRVASMLSLPLPQVQVVQELQKMAGKEKKAGTRKKREEEIGQQEVPTQAKNAAPREKKAAVRKKREGEIGQQEIATQQKNAAPREKNAARPGLLIDVIRNAANGHGSRRLDEVSA
jgi:hypothetical protein